MRIAAFNVENLFNPARALDQRTWSEGRPTPEAFEHISTLLEESSHAPEIKVDILRTPSRLGLRNHRAARVIRSSTVAVCRASPAVRISPF